MTQDAKSIYVPGQHTAKPIGYKHDTIFAFVELWADEPPECIVLGDYRYRLERENDEQ